MIACSNKLTLEKTRERCCSDAHGLQFLYRNKQCNQCSLKTCFAEIIRYTLTTFSNGDVIF